MKIEDLKTMIKEAFIEKNQNEKEAIEVLDQQNQNIDMLRTMLDKVVYKLGKSQDMGERLQQKENKYIELQKLVSQSINQASQNI